jgi:hypothetical protein
MEEHDKPRSACVDRKLSLLDPELEVSIEHPVSDAGRRAEFVAMSNDEHPPVAEQQVATDHRDVALDALARFEDREDGVTDADRQVVTRLSQWRLVQFGVPRCALPPMVDNRRNLGMADSNLLTNAPPQRRPAKR